MFGHVFYGAAVVQAVGKLDKDHAHVVVESQQDAFEILGLKAFRAHRDSLPVLIVEHGLDFRQSVHEGGYLVAEKAADVLDRVAGVLHHVVKQRRADGLASQADVGHHDLRDLHGVYHVRLAGTPADVLVRLVGEFERLADRLDLFGVAEPWARDFHK